jgi:hypothetical protein
MKLSDFQDEKAVEVVAKLLVPIGNIVQNKDVAKKQGGTMLEFVSAMLANNASDVKTMLAILNDVEPSEYHCSAASVLRDAMAMLSDPELLQLFGLQSETSTDSGSASGKSAVTTE